MSRTEDVKQQTETGRHRIRSFFSDVGFILVRGYRKLPPLVQVLCLLPVYFVFQALIPILLILHSESLGVWWSILLGLYMLAVALTTGYLMSRRRINQLKVLYGEDFVYKSFPREKKRDERRAARARHGDFGPCKEVVGQSTEKRGNVNDP